MDKWIQLLIDVVEIIILVVMMIHLIPIVLVHPGITFLVIILVVFCMKLR